MSRQNFTEIDAFVKDVRPMKKKSSVISGKKKEKKEMSEEAEYACIGGNPKMRREMKRHKDMIKKCGKMSKEDDD